ncbi:MAG: acyl-CoA dehydrogenase family protein [Micromonosporaceae bacterium]
MVQPAAGAPVRTLAAAAMVAAAEEIADAVLFPAADAVDRADRVPASHLDLFAERGFYGATAPAEAGGFDDLATVAQLVETLASGCLTTTFVWLQHLSVVRAVAASARPGMAQRWLAPLAHGQRRAGVALAGLRGGTDPLRVCPAEGGFRLDGVVPWVTGWDLVDTVYIAALDDADVVHYLLVDAEAGPTVSLRPLELLAVSASRTVNLHLTGHGVPADRLVGTQPYPEWSRSDAPGSALNGFLALGVARRCARLLGPGPLDDALDRCRAALLAADSITRPVARAAASELALRAAAMLAVSTGSRAVLGGNPAQRLWREAGFLLVFGSRPAIRDELLTLLQP